jgi:replicative DNA helicase
MVMETDSLSTEEIASKALRVVNEASLRMAKSNGQLLSEACDDFISEFKARIKGTGLSGYPTGLLDLDATIGGYEQGRLYIVAGRTGMGKTSWLVYSMLKLAMENPSKMIVFYTTEMSKSELIQRMASIVSGVPVMALKTPHRLSREQLQSVSTAMTTLKGVNVWLEDLSAPTPNDVRLTLESLKNRYGAYICFIDGLYRMKTGDNKKDGILHQRYGECAQELKSISRDLMPVVATHQLNRDAQSKGDAGTLPSLSNLRESGKIEEEADVVVMLHRPKYYDRMLVDDIAQILVAKNRSGATGVINSMYDAPTMNFSPCHTTNVDLSDL